MTQPFIYLGNNTVREKGTPPDYPRGDSAVWDTDEYRQAYKEWNDSLPRYPFINNSGREIKVGEEVMGEIVTARTFTRNEKYGYGCAECCNGDRCDEDCTGRYKGNRKNCPFCKGTGWFKEIPSMVFSVRSVSQPAEKPEDNQGHYWNNIVATVAAADICRNTKPEDGEGLDNWKIEVIRRLSEKFIVHQKLNHDSKTT